MASGTVRVGVVGRPHGLRGAFHVHMDDPGSDCLDGVREVWTLGWGKPPRKHSVAAATSAGPGRWTLQLEGVTTREAALAMKGREVHVDAACLELEAGEILVADLPGHDVVEAGRVVGRIESTYWNGAHDVLTVETAEGPVDFPVAPGYVIGEDEQGRVEVVGFEWFAEANRPGAGRGKK